MSKRNLLIFLSLIILLVVLLFSMVQSVKSEFYEKKSEIEVFSKEAKEFAQLKKKYKNKKDIKKIIKSLNRISRATKDFTKSDQRVLVFDKLNKSSLNKLVKKIMNSSLELKKIIINRGEDGSAMLRVEIKK